MFGRRSVRGRAAALGLVVASSCGGSSSPAPSAPVSALEIPRLDGGGAGIAEIPRTGIRFGRVPPVVGARWSVSVEAISVSSGPDHPQVDEYVSSYGVEVLATNNHAPSRVRVVFDSNVYQSAAAGRRPTAIHGKTYVIDASEALVRDANGSSAAAEEAERVLDNFPDLGTRTQIDQVLPDSVMAVGDERHELAEAVLRVIHPRSWILSSGRAALRSVDGDVAVVEIAIDATSKNGLRMTVDGEARIGVRDARLTSLSLKGTYGTGETSGVVTIRRKVGDR